MSGLIWAGIGKGIADAGTTFANVGIKQYEMDRQDERDTVKEERLLKRQEALDQLKADREESKAQLEAAKAIDVDARATKIGEQRAGKQLTTEAGNLTKNAGQMAGDSPAMSEDEYKAHLESLTPAQRNLVSQTGLINRAATRNETRLQAADDQIQAAREVGVSSTSLKSYQDLKKSVLEEIKLENTEKSNGQRHAEIMAQQERLGNQFAATSRISQQNADANTTRANKPAGSGSDAVKVRSTYTDDSGTRVAVMSDGSTRPLGKGADFGKSVERVIANLEKTDFDFKQLPLEQKKAIATQRLATEPSASQGGQDHKAEPAASLPSPKTQGEVSVLKPGTRYKAPDGSIRVKG